MFVTLIYLAELVKKKTHIPSLKTHNRSSLELRALSRKKCVFAVHQFV